MGMNLQKLSYLLSGLVGWANGRPICPACQSTSKHLTDRKYFHVLYGCLSCGLKYRFPSESETSAKAFYQSDYAEPGLTTSLPDDETLARLVQAAFQGSAKDFSHQITLFEALGVSRGARVLDFGSNWGYGAWQFREHGFDVTAFEISLPRAAFGSKLGLDIHTNFADVGDNYDIVYSNHVLEHIPNPKEALCAQMSIVKRGGLVLAHTPNGSEARRERSPKSFRANWGQVHPVLLTDSFVAAVAGQRPFLLTSGDELSRVFAWDRASQIIQAVDGDNLFCAIQC